MWGNSPPPQRCAQTMSLIKCNDKRKLFLFGGVNADGAPLNDLFVMEVENLRWKEWNIAGVSQPRSKCACYTQAHPLCQASTPLGSG